MGCLAFRVSIHVRDGTLKFSKSSLVSQAVSLAADMNTFQITIQDGFDKRTNIEKPTAFCSGPTECQTRQLHFGNSDGVFYLTSLARSLNSEISWNQHFQYQATTW